MLALERMLLLIWRCFDDSKVAVISYICTIDKTSIYAKQAICVKRAFKKTGILRSEGLPVLFLHRGVRIFGEIVGLITGSR